jgi:hypothetical protein
VARHHDHLVLMRIVAILLSLAILAERLIAAPPHIRYLVLRLLRPAEAVARGLLVGKTGLRGLQGLPSTAPFDGDGPADAARLAWCFRALAMALGAILARFAVSGASAGRAHALWFERVRKAIRPLFTPVTVVPDTS